MEPHMKTDDKEQVLLRRIKQRRKRTAGVVVVLLCLICLGVIAVISGSGGDGGGTKTVTLEISCADLAENMDRLEDEGVRDYVPEDGSILSPVEVTMDEGDTVYDILYRQCRKDNIHLESHNDPIYGSRYIEGIGHIYEKDAGKRSGWLYKVDGKQPDYGCSKYYLEGGEKIQWIYVTEYTENGE